MTHTRIELEAMQAQIDQAKAIKQIATDMSKILATFTAVASDLQRLAHPEYHETRPCQTCLDRDGSGDENMQVSGPEVCPNCNLRL